jgi:hypothetical protein
MLKCYRCGLGVLCPDEDKPLKKEGEFGQAVTTKFDFFEIAIRVISRRYIPKFLQGGQIHAYY